MASCSAKEQTPLLTGDIAANDSVMITAYYDIDGDIYLEEFFSDSLGRFTYNPAIPTGTDLTLYINGTSYGVRLENGSTSNISIDSAGTATFSGANVAESRWLNECFNGYNSRRFKHVVARDGAYDPAKYTEMLEGARDLTASLLPEVKNDSLRAYYERLGAQFYNRTKANIIMSDFYYNKYDKESGVREMPAEYQELMKADPNGDEARRTGALVEWLYSVPTDRGADYIEKLNAMCDSIDKKIINPANKRMLFNSCSEILFNYNMSVDNIRTFMDGMG
ncbi:MAG: hypothetical protein K2K92_03035, partial [Duncaniella sp.]|nr:hypothetical protein [Duncaniella sp.]